MSPRILFWLVCGLALGLLGLLLVAPALEPSSRLLTLFAQDATVRRTTLASALGMLVTASVFFRGQPSEKSRKRSRPAPPRDVVGA